MRNIAFAVLQAINVLINCTLLSADFQAAADLSSLSTHLLGGAETAAPTEVLPGRFVVAVLSEQRETKTST